MPTFSETGHSKNVANFQDLIAFVTGYGTTYNPSKAALKLENLQSKVDAEQVRLAAVIDKNTNYNNAVNERVAAFNDIKVLGTRIVSALSITDASKEKIDDAKGFNRKLQGKRASTKIDTPADPTMPAPKTISASQQSYDQVVQHFNGLIATAQSETSYSPNEADLKISTLAARAKDMLKKNNAVATQYAGVSNARIARDKGLYGEKTGLVAIANDVKDYVKSIFGYTSPEFKQIRKIAFKAIKQQKTRKEIRDTSKEKFTTAKEVKSTAKEKIGTAKEIKPTARENIVTAKGVRPTAKRIIATAKRIIATAKGVIATAKVKLPTAKVGNEKQKQT